MGTINITDTHTADAAAYVTKDMLAILDDMQNLYAEAERLTAWADCKLLDLANLKPQGLSQVRYAAALHAAHDWLNDTYADSNSLRVRMAQATRLARKHGATTGAELGAALDLVKETTGKAGTSRRGKGKSKSGSTSGKGKGNGGAGGNEGKPATVPDAIDALDAASLAVAADPSKVTKVERNAAEGALRAALVLALAAGFSQDDIAGVIADATAAAATLSQAKVS